MLSESLLKGISRVCALKYMAKTETHQKERGFLGIRGQRRPVI